jgi:NitT/TauT family transport system ATP-binding protein
LVQEARTLVTLSHVDKAYASGTLALRDVSLDVREREFVSLLGPSGCGKTTVLRLIAGLGALSGGAIEWPSGPPGRNKRDIGFVFQEPTLMPWAPVFDNVWTPLRLAGQSRAAARAAVKGAISMVALDGFEDAYPRELSGGMKMRVSIARALVTRPRLLLMDEPFAALDEITRFKLNNDLLELCAAQHLTVVFVTHSVYESVYLSSRILVMSARPGRIIDEVAIPAPSPRGAAFRASAAYHEHCTYLSQRLEEAMRG